ncbi:MAG: hypothetical protein KatS3mg035_1457 [Bacteroidia bacterium]|nr:MAG: hypothetical protein KatS3mg035_1457 [Bacteroidia bacterium]
MENKSLLKALFWISFALIAFVLGLMGLSIYIVVQIIGSPQPPRSPKSPSKVPITTEAPHYQQDNIWKSPDFSTITENKSLIEYGKELITHTAKYFGPKGSIAPNTTNGMNCQNCHLEAGTKAFGNNYGLVASTYPKYRARSGTIENIEKRINDCFERSLNGKPLAPNSQEMQAIKAYIQWIGSNVKKDDNTLKGLSMKNNEISFLDRAASPEKGKSIYQQKCQSCHQPNGEGLKNDNLSEYIYPPLWGQNSYNDAAGLYRISNFAKFVKYNMPLGANHNNIMLTDEEAWDLAAFVNSQPRPHKNTPNDWPHIHEKPFDHPFGPFADPYNEKQHKLGPFQPIQEYYKKQKKS